MATPYKVPEPAATVLAQLCCHNGHLPQGAPTSPIISNMICGRLDSELLRLASRYKCAYTRYVDDITFSTNQRTFPGTLAVVEDVEGVRKVLAGNMLVEAIEGNGFSISSSKFRLQRPSARQEVTGLVVNEFPNVRRKEIRRVRAMTHAISTYGVDRADEHFRTKYDAKQRRDNESKPTIQMVLEGRLNYVRMVRGRTI